MHSVRPLALLAALALFAGCLGGDEDAAPLAATPSPASPSASTSTGESPDGLVNDSTDAALPEEVALMVSFDGKLDNHVGVCEFAHVGDCVDTPTGTGSSMWLQETVGAPRAVLVEMTWSAATAATQTLGLMAVACWEPEEGGMMCEHIDAKEGSSPLAMDVGNLALPDGATLRLFGYLPSALPDSPVPGTFVWYELEQPFHIEGSVTVQPPAA